MIEIVPTQQQYRCIKTNELAIFIRLEAGRYERHDGVEFTLGKLNREYKWLSPRRKGKRTGYWDTSPNGFRVWRQFKKEKLV